MNASTYVLVYTNELYSQHIVILIWVHNWKDGKATHYSKKVFNCIPDISVLATSLHKMDFLFIS